MSELVDDLNDILEYLYDSRNGFQECASLVKDIRLQSLFEDLSQQRGAFAEAIARVIAELGGKPVESGSMVAAMHRTMVDLKSLVTNGDPVAISNEVKRGEGRVIDNYREVLKQTLPQQLGSLLEQQLHLIEANLQRIEHLAKS